MTAQELIDEFEQKKLNSEIGRLIVSAIMEQLPAIIAVGLKSPETIYLITETGKRLEISADMVREVQERICQK